MEIRFHITTMMMYKISLIWAALMLMENNKYSSSEAKVVHGNLWTLENWKFLARFCFMNNHGRFEYDVRYEEAYAVQNIDLYYDTKEQWPRVYGRTADLITCKGKESVLQVSFSVWSALPTASKFIFIHLCFLQKNVFLLFSAREQSIYQLNNRYDGLRMLP